MATATFSEQLARYGPHQPTRSLPTLQQARQYCRDLAQSHYENFTVASWLLPRALRPHFYSIYAWCRWADDLADETYDREQSRELLQWWEHGLEACYAGRYEHPVYVALAETIEQFEIPTAPFRDLLTAFQQDQTVTRYETRDDLLDYCTRSANPVGRLVLYLGRCNRPELAQLSDSICTGLQLANFWQDVASDHDRGRIYLPAKQYRAVGYTDDMFARKEFNPQFRSVLSAETEIAESFLTAGLPLIDLVPRQLRLDISLFIHGGLGILRKIRQIDYDVWSRRPKLGKWDRANILAASVHSAFLSRSARNAR